MYAVDSHDTASIATLAKRGRPIAQPMPADTPPDADCPRDTMTCNKIKPMTSSMIAALDKTAPKRVVAKPACEIMENVVPNDVELRAAPAAKA